MTENSMRDARGLGLLCAALFVSGCGEGGITGIKRDYQDPTTGPTATVVVRSLTGTPNQRVIVHGQRVCDAGDARLLGLLNSVTIDIPKRTELSFAAKADEPVRVSTTAAREGVVCQPVLQFTPQSGKTYDVLFYGCEAGVKERGGGDVEQSAYRGCVIGDSWDSRKPTYGFWLRDPPVTERQAGD